MFILLSGSAVLLTSLGKAYEVSLVLCFNRMTDFKEENQTITLTIPTQGSIPVISLNNWIFFMQRYMPSGFNWNLTWNDYKDGFGSSDSDDFWMGLERLHLLTTSGSYRLRMEWQENPTNYWFSVEYWFFYIEDEAESYKLHVSGYVPGDDGRVLCVYETSSQIW